MATTSVILLLGSNDKSASAIIENAIKVLGSSVGEIVKLSREYRSKAYGFTSEREFINRAVELNSEYDA